MSGKHRARCTCCGGHKSDVGPISWGGNCRKCGLELFVENALGISNKTGPAHRRRLRGYARMIERELRASAEGIGDVHSPDATPLPRDP